MTDRPQDTNPTPRSRAPEPAPFVVTNTGALPLPSGVASGLRLALEHLFTTALEVNGPAPGSERSLIADRATALALDLETLASHVLELGKEPRVSEVTHQEADLCATAGELASVLMVAASRLHRGADAVERETAERVAREPEDGDLEGGA